MKFEGLIFSVNKNFDMELFKNSLSLKLEKLDLAIKEYQYFNIKEGGNIRINIELYYPDKDIEKIYKSMPIPTSMYRIILTVMRDYEDINKEPYCKFEKIE